MGGRPATHRRVLALAWPVVLAQVATAMTGVVDTAVMGRFGDKTDLAMTCRSAARVYSLPGSSAFYRGFRLVRSTF